MDVSVRELKNNLSAYLRRVQAGEAVHITLRGKRIARLLPEPAGVRQESEAEAVDRLRAMGWVRPGQGDRVRGADQPIDWPAEEQPLSQQILDERE